MIDAIEPFVLQAAPGAVQKNGIQYDWNLSRTNRPLQTMYAASNLVHSVRKLFTGFAIASLIAWKLTVSNVISNAPMPEIRKTHNEMFVR